ncbi:MAG TPA: metalloregulator ArsR/SmtB family transcription factor [Burkholderiales bacterium]|nr:metalloregulator ArsR/SmtB family transcription factor [Burkholderiales bacterium]
MESTTAVASLAALAQDARLAIFRLLVQKGPEGLCVGDIAAKFGMAAATLSFHLKELTSAGLLVARQEGRFIYYAPNFEEMNALVSYLTENCCGGQTCAPACRPLARKRKEKVT